MIIKHNSKRISDCFFFKFLQRSVAGKHLMRFLKTWFSNFSGVAWWFLLHFIMLILYVVCVCRLEHGAALTSSTVSTLKYCLLWRSKFCPSCLRCQLVLHDLCLKDERSTWSGRVASLSPWTLVKYDFYYMYSKTFICPAPVTGVHGFLSYSQIWLNIAFYSDEIVNTLWTLPCIHFCSFDWIRTRISWLSLLSDSKAHRLWPVPTLASFLT